MPARYVKPYVQRGKNDALDAEAICEAVGRPTMRFAAIKSVEQQSALTLHRTREILVKQETMLANLIRGCLGEFGIVAPLGIRRVVELIAIVRDESDTRLPTEAQSGMILVAGQLEDLQRRRALAPAERGKPASRDHPRRRPDHGVRGRGYGGQRRCVQISSPLCCLPGAHTQGALHRR